MTIDKTMQLVNGVASYNDSVDLELIPDIEYVKVAELARAIAILDTAKAPVKVWGFDLDSYFHRTGKQRRDCWMSGFVHLDGFGFDPRIQFEFGQREAPVLCGRQSCFLVWAIQRELARLDEAYPAVEPAAGCSLLASAAARGGSHGQGGRGRCLPLGRPRFHRHVRG